MPYFIGRRPPRPAPQPPQRLASGWVRARLYLAGTVDPTRYPTRAAAEAAAHAHGPGEQVRVLQARTRGEALAKLMGHPYSHWHYLTVHYVTLPLNRALLKLGVRKRPQRPWDVPPETE